MKGLTSYQERSATRRKENVDLSIHLPPAREDRKQAFIFTYLTSTVIGMNCISICVNSGMMYMITVRIRIIFCRPIRSPMYPLSRTTNLKSHKVSLRQPARCPFSPADLIHGRQPRFLQSISTDVIALFGKRPTENVAIVEEMLAVRSIEIVAFRC